MGKHKNQRSQEFFKLVDDKIERTKRACDRCGTGTFMAQHQDRFYCGNCGLTIWKK